MPVPFRRLPSGTILVDVAEPTSPQRVVLYARCPHPLDGCVVRERALRASRRGPFSRVAQKSSSIGCPIRKVCRLTGWATDGGFAVGQVVAEVGSGLNGKRPKLARVLSDPSASVIVVEHRDRLARFGVEHLQAALAAQGRRIVVVDDGETTDDLVRDMIEVLTVDVRAAVRAPRRP